MNHEYQSKMEELWQSFPKFKKSFPLHHNATQQHHKELIIFSEYYENELRFTTEDAE